GIPIDPPPYVLLQFEARPKGRWVSPQAPISYGKGEKRKPELPRLKELSKSINLPNLIAELPKAPLPTVADAGQNLVAANPPAAENGDGDVQFFEGNTFNLTNAPPQPQANQAPQQAEAQVPQQAQRGANFDANIDFQQRSKRYQSAAQQSLANNGTRGMNQANVPALPQKPPSTDLF